MSFFLFAHPATVVFSLLCPSSCLSIFSVSLPPLTHRWKEWTSCSGSESPFKIKCRLAVTFTFNCLTFPFYSAMAFTGRTLVCMNAVFVLSWNIIAYLFLQKKKNYRSVMKLALSHQMKCAGEDYELNNVDNTHVINVDNKTALSFKRKKSKKNCAVNTRYVKS